MSSKFTRLQASVKAAEPPSQSESRPTVSRQKKLSEDTFEALIAAVSRAQRLKLLTIKEVCERTCSGASFIYAEAAAGRFPKPIKIGASKSRRAAARFVEGEVSDWIEQRIAERDAEGNAMNQ